MLGSADFAVDNAVVEGAYAVVVAVAWAWALSQIRMAVRLPDRWHVITAGWMVSKALFFTVAALAWWTNRLYAELFATMLVLLAITHLVTFWAWVRLPPPDRPDPLPDPPVPWPPEGAPRV